MPIKNLASGTLAESVSASTTTLLVYVGEGGATIIRNVWPTPPFYASIMPANPSAGVANSLDSEIVLVTAVGNDQVGNVALTVERAAKGSTAKSFTAGAIVTNGVYMEDILDRIYPVGSIYMSATLSTTSQVANALGGTWEAFGAGRVPVGVDSSDADFEVAGLTGGEKEHTLATTEMPSHNHTLSYTANSSGVGTSKTYGTVYSAGNQSIIRNTTIRTTGELAYWGIENTGGGQSHNNLQPYITCYMYKRIA